MITTWVKGLAEVTGVLPGPKKTGVFRPAYGITQEAYGAAIEAERGKLLGLKGKIAVSKALGSYVSMREMVATEKAYKVAGIPLKKIKHGVLVPSTATARIMALQAAQLTEAQEAATDVGAALYDYAGETAILTGKVKGLYGTVAELEKKLKEKPPIVKTTLFGDLGSIDLSGFKEIAIIGIIALAGVSLLGGALKK